MAIGEKFKRKCVFAPSPHISKSENGSGFVNWLLVERLCLESMHAREDWRLMEYTEESIFNSAWVFPFRKPSENACKMSNEVLLKTHGWSFLVGPSHAGSGGMAQSK